MKAVFVLCLVALALSATNYRHVEIYPNDGSAPTKKWVSEDFLHNELIFYSNVTFRDITGLKEYPLEKELQFPDPSHQKVVKPILSNIKTSQLKEYLDGLTSNPHRNSRRQGSEKSIEWAVAELNKVIKGLSAERQKLFKVETVEIRGYVAKSIIVTFQGSSTENVIFGA